MSRWVGLFYLSRIRARRIILGVSPSPLVSDDGNAGGCGVEETTCMKGYLNICSNLSLLLSTGYAARGNIIDKSETGFWVDCFNSCTMTLNGRPYGVFRLDREANWNATTNMAFLMFGRGTVL